MFSYAFSIGPKSTDGTGFGSSIASLPYELTLTTSYLLLKSLKERPGGGINEGWMKIPFDIRDVSLAEKELQVVIFDSTVSSLLEVSQGLGRESGHRLNLHSQSFVDSNSFHHI